MKESSFEYLSGAIIINADAPHDWLLSSAEELRFWEEPNNDDWGVKLSRILYHESIHFWQFLSSSYIASLVADEWSRLLHFEATGELLPTTERVELHSLPRSDYPFSLAELVEAWARYWDVHTRGPIAIIQEEGIPVHDQALLWQNFGKDSLFYSGVAFDTIMQVGEDCEVYGRPYRWLLERLNGNSAVAALLFPIVVYSAFNSPYPIDVFNLCIEAALRSNALQQILSNRTGDVNLDWLTNYRFIVESIVRPVFKILGIPFFVNGFEVIQNSCLKNHPIFSEYPTRFQFLISEYFNVFSPTPYQGDPNGEKYVVSLTKAGKAMPLVYVFGLPGQPFYRALLGHLVPPPQIGFKNTTLYAFQLHQLFDLLRSCPVSLGTFIVRDRQNSVQTYKLQMEILSSRISRFRAAEKAVSLGLPANAFET